MATGRVKLGRPSRVGTPRAPDLQSIYGRIEKDALDLGRGGKIVRSRVAGPSSEPVRDRGGRSCAALDLSLGQRVNAARRLPPAIVKVVRNGQTGLKADLQNQLNYLTREGDLALTTANGEDGPRGRMARCRAVWDGRVWGRARRILGLCESRSQRHGLSACTFCRE